jgi:hypothetical protein
MFQICQLLNETNPKQIKNETKDFIIKLFTKTELHLCCLNFELVSNSNLIISFSIFTSELLYRLKQS